MTIDQPVSQREAPCPTCQQMKETVSATYQTWLERPFDPLYNEAHNASVRAYLRHRLGEHKQERVPRGE